MKDIIKDIRNAIDAESYLSALALALTLPDICSQVENNVQKSDRYLYIDWFNDHMPAECYTPDISGFEDQTFDGKMCYSLRCRILHNGNTDVKKTDLNVCVDELVLLIPDDKSKVGGYDYRDIAGKKTVTCIDICYLSKTLCDAAEEFYDNWTNKEDFDKHSIYRNQTIPVIRLSMDEE